MFSKILTDIQNTCIHTHIILLGKFHSVNLAHFDDEKPELRKVERFVEGHTARMRT